MQLCLSLSVCVVLILVVVELLVVAIVAWQVLELAVQISLVAHDAVPHAHGYVELAALPSVTLHTAWQ